MKLTAISATYGRKHNLGKFNNLNIDLTLSADLEPGDDEALAAEALRTMARNQVMLELARVETKIAAKVDGLYAGLPPHVQREIEEATSELTDLRTEIAMSNGHQVNAILQPDKGTDATWA